MSFANYLGRESGGIVPTFNDLVLTNEANDLNDAARLSDTITYMGVASYPLSTQTTLTPTDLSFTTLFYDPSGVTPPRADYLRVKPSVDTITFAQLANLSYKVYINSTNVEKFAVRVGCYDSSLQHISSYNALEYDPSANTRDPPVIDGFTLYGYSIDYPNNCEYVFLEVDTSGGGTMEFEFDYAHSQLEVAIDTSQEEGLLTSNPTTNIFGIDYYISIRDISGVEKDLTQIEAEIDQLQTDVSNLETTTTDISNNYLKLAGGTLSGNLNLSGNDILGVSTPTDASGAVPKAYVDGLVSPLSSAIQTLDASMAIVEGDIGALDASMSAVESSVASLQSGKLSLSGGTMTGVIQMGNRQIKNLATPSSSGDAVNKAYVDGIIPPTPVTSTTTIKSANIQFYNVTVDAQGEYDYTQNVLQLFGLQNWTRDRDTFRIIWDIATTSDPLPPAQGDSMIMAIGYKNQDWTGNQFTANRIGSTGNYTRLYLDQLTADPTAPDIFTTDTSILFKLRNPNGTARQITGQITIQYFARESTGLAPVGGVGRPIQYFRPETGIKPYIVLLGDSGLPP